MICTKNKKRRDVFPNFRPRFIRFPPTFFQTHGDVCNTLPETYPDTVLTHCTSPNDTYPQPTTKSQDTSRKAAFIPHPKAGSAKEQAPSVS